MGSFVINNGFTTETTSAGILRKTATREMVYTNTWSASLDTGFSSAGWLVSSSTATSTLSYTFWGTGVEWLFKTNASLAMNITIAINGSSNLSSFTTSYLPASTGTTFTASTGLISGTSAGQGYSKVSITGLTLGLHTIRITQNAANNTCLHSSFDIITPIHINNPTLKIGNQSLKSVTKYSPEKSVSNAGPDLSKAKAWCIYDQVNQRILASFNISAALNRASNCTDFFFEKPFKGKFVTSGAVGGTANQFRLVSLYGLSNEPSLYPNGVEIVSENSGGTAAQSIVSIACFGELIDE